MAGGKKFNIWIAYSDLFTNLSTFLFISALGLFVAMGAGQRASVVVGAPPYCGLPASVHQKLTEDSLLGRVKPDARLDAAPGRCTDYYLIDTFQFEAAIVGFGEYRSFPVSKLKRDDLRAQICSPIWRTLGLDLFRKKNGRITFVGYGAINEAREAPLECSSVERTPEPAIEFRGKRYDPVRVVWECERNGDNAYPGLCDLVHQCSKSPNALCQQILAADLRNQQNTIACRKATVESQAKLLFDLCEGAPLAPGFQTQDFDPTGDPKTQVMARDAYRADKRREYWGDVSYDGKVQGWGSRVLSDTEVPPVTLPRKSGGAVVLVKVEVDR